MKRHLRTGQSPLAAVARIIGLALAVSATSGRSQTLAAADQKWNDLSRLSAPAPVARASSGKKASITDVEASVKQQAARARQAAQAAREFYTQFPSHPKANEARKMEAMSTVQATESADSAGVQSALAVARPYRQNTQHSPADRLDVSLAMDRLELSAKIRQGQEVDTAAKWKALADVLRAQFGDMPALDAYCLDIARTADPATTVQLANAVKQSRSASAAAKAKAQAFLDREALVGKPVQLKLSQVDGGDLVVGQPGAKVRVILAWDASDPGALASMSQYEQNLRNAEVVYVALGGSASAVRESKQRVRVAGAYCHAPAGAGYRVVAEALKLRYTPLPRLFVIDKQGAVVGAGSTRDLVTLLSQVRN